MIKLTQSFTNTTNTMEEKTLADVLYENIAGDPLNKEASEDAMRAFAELKADRNCKDFATVGKEFYDSYMGEFDSEEEYADYDWHNRYGYEQNENGEDVDDNGDTYNERQYTDYLFSYGEYDFQNGHVFCNC